MSDTTPTQAALDAAFYTQAADTGWRVHAYARAEDEYFRARIIAFVAVARYRTPAAATARFDAGDFNHLDGTPGHVTLRALLDDNDADLTDLPDTFDLDDLPALEIPNHEADRFLVTLPDGSFELRLADWEYEHATQDVRMREAVLDRAHQLTPRSYDPSDLLPQRENA